MCSSLSWSAAFPDSLGGKLDLAVQRFVDAWMAFPGLLVLLTIMSIAGRGLPQMILVLGIAGGISGSRVIRSAVIAIKENDYFLAAQAVGTPTSQILIRHVLPNIIAPLIIISSQHQHRGSDYGRGFLKLPRIWSAPEHSQLGWPAQSGRASVHGGGPTAGNLARALPDDCRLLPQHVRRCHARSARSPTARRSGQLRHCTKVKRKRSLLARLINPFHG